MGEFFKDFKAESKRVIWPTRQELISKTITVISTSVLTSCILLVLDWVYNNVLLLLHQWI
ncbi:MAG: preprotein translocase subunit SecE [Epulopiscium sp. Nele67-Bin002]|nr:MAG: preprotein translocase subunit SecE [Epulopiscium sp. Nuni2H_MBin001]OON92402.1 MAG: preprotein translocase subunit SecE [Epulopiscium sp. Nele67-Bin001]OON92538.1 MAG: preprotein translocase subunit SecE [Epulopiscium sp. Nele67-Bin002]